MSETKFTKGEWLAVNGLEVGEEILFVMVETEQITDKGQVICRLTKSVEKTPLTDEDVANANLIAAAPEMCEENERRSILLGEVYVALQQEDFELAFKLIHDSETIDFSSGSPVAVSPSLAKARGEK